MEKKKKFKTKSPIKEKLLRAPGESIQNKQLDILTDEVLPYILTPLLFVYLAVIEWFRAYYAIKPQPVIYTVLALGVVIYCGFKLIKTVKKLDTLKQGRLGERAVGQYLEGFRGKGARVLHDIPGDDFNIDHVVIHNKGIYLIETKTYSKPEIGEPVITYDGEKIYLNGTETISDPVNQARMSAKWLHKTLLVATGKKFDVRPVVVFPGWYVKKTENYKTSDTWVLNPKGLGAFISKQKDALENEDVKLAYNQLSKYIRSKL